MIFVFKNTRSKIRQVFVFLKRAIMKLTQIYDSRINYSLFEYAVINIMPHTIVKPIEP